MGQNYIINSESVEPFALEDCIVDKSCLNDHVQENQLNVGQEHTDTQQITHNIALTEKSLDIDETRCFDTLALKTVNNDRLWQTDCVPIYGPQYFK